MRLMDAATNAYLREVLRQTGLTHEAIARAVNRVAAEQGDILRSNKSSVTHWINGTTPQVRTISYLCEALSRVLGRRVGPVEIGYRGGDESIASPPDDPIEALARLGRADVDRRGLLTGTVSSRFTAE